MQADEDKNKMYEISITENIQIEKIKDEPCYSSEDASDEDVTSGVEVPLITSAGGCLPQNLLSKEAEEKVVQSSCQNESYACKREEEFPTKFEEDKVVQSSCQNESYACKREEELPTKFEEVMIEMDVIKDEPCSSPDISDDDVSSPGVEVPLITSADGSMPQYKVVTEKPQEEVLEKQIYNSKNIKGLSNSEAKRKQSKQIGDNNANKIRKRKRGSFISEDRFSCDMCDYKSKWRSSLNRHQRTHTGEKPYSCDCCSYKCKQKSHLIQHLRTHTGERPFCCNICSFKFNHKSNLIQHIKKHTGEKKRISCNICSFQCYQESDLKRHIRKHTGEKPYSCSVCSYKCSQQGHLKQHERKHK